MQDSHFFSIDDSSQANRNTNSPEVLLADLIGDEDAELMFEGLVDRHTGMGNTLEKLSSRHFEADVTGGDPDDDCYQAEVVGEEAVGGQTPTPDQSVTEQLLESMGIASTDGETIQTKDKLDKRDRVRWELKPESSDDYWERFE